MKTTTYTANEHSTFMAHFTAAVPKTPKRPDTHFLDISEGEPASQASVDLASKIVQAWHGDAKTSVSAMPMANGGMATYRARRGTETYFVKAALVKNLSTNSIQLLAQKKEIVQEANLARLAANTTGVAPKVLYIDPNGLGFATEMLDMREVTFQQAKGSARKMLCRAFAQIHQSAPDHQLDRVDGPWWSMIDIATCCAQAKTPPVQTHELLRLEQGLNKAIEKLTFKPKPCHNDLKIRNLLSDGNKVGIVDWNRFSLGDPMRDLAYFSTTADIGPQLTHELLTDYMSQLSARELPIGNETARYNVHFAFYLNKKQSFLSQWEGSRPASEYFARHLVDQLPSIQPILEKEIGLRIHLQ